MSSAEESMTHPSNHRLSVSAAKTGMTRKGLCLAALAFFLFYGVAEAAAYQYRLASTGKTLQDEKNVIGFLQYHKVKKDGTFLDIAKEYDLGYDPLVDANPQVDPWIPGVGKKVVIPTFWILPPSKYHQVVVNIPEFRLYRFYKQSGLVVTYPIGIGTKGYQTQPTVCRVADMVKNPTWVPPKSCWADHGKAPVPPGPDNPVGDYWIGLTAQHVGIHGTNKEWGMGMRVSHGCIRLYPKDIPKLFKQVNVRTVVEIIYDPVKIGIKNDTIYLEVHPDIYKKIPNFLQYTENLIRQRDLWGCVDKKQVIECVKEEDGIPTPIGHIQKGGDGLTFFENQELHDRFL